MATLQVFPPNAENEALFAEIPGVRQTPIPVVAFDGPEPDGSLGPEAAGALLVLHMTMIDEKRTQAFWRQVALTCRAASQTQGFIRMIAFFDGMANWALGFWRTVEDAQAFARSKAHTAAIAEMHKQNFEYMHFAGLYRPVEERVRHVYCERCEAEGVMPQDTCPSCGNEFSDVFRLQSDKGKKAAIR